MWRRRKISIHMVVSFIFSTGVARKDVLSYVWMVNDSADSNVCEV